MSTIKPKFFYSEKKLKFIKIVLENLNNNYLTLLILLINYKK